tara:strand:+ start:1367 stop:1531 length:165 start_codon:yes stop_codon:yes gene_type:complete
MLLRGINSRKAMVIKVDKSEEFKKSGKKLISEYEGEKWLEELKKEKEVPQHLAE